MGTTKSNFPQVSLVLLHHFHSPPFKLPFIQRILLGLSLCTSRRDVSNALGYSALYAVVDDACYHLLGVGHRVPHNILRSSTNHQKNKCLTLRPFLLPHAHNFMPFIGPNLPENAIPLLRFPLIHLLQYEIKFLYPSKTF